MSDLVAFQRAFAAALAEPAESVFAGPALAVHRNTSALAARDALADNYPVTRTLVGEEAFAACLADFVAAHPPTDPRLFDYGEEFPPFLTLYAPFVEAPYLADVARLERLYTEALFAADGPILDVDGIGDWLDFETILAVHPAARCERFGSPAVSLWLAHQAGAAPTALDDLHWSDEAVLVTRPDGAVSVTAVAPALIAFLSGCATGVPVWEAARAATTDVVDLADIFATLIAAGAFARPPSQRNLS